MAQPPKIDWTIARAWYLALPMDKRTFASVASRFGVSRSQVSRRAGEEGWDAVARDADRRVERRALERVIRSRADRLARTIEVYDRANDLAAQLLPIDEATGLIDVGKIEAMPRVDQILEKLPGLFRMAELAAGEATDRVAVAEVQPVILAIARIAIMRAPADERGSVLREIEAATAGLVQIGPGTEVAA